MHYTTVTCFIKTEAINYQETIAQKCQESEVCLCVEGVGQVGGDRASVRELGGGVGGESGTRSYLLKCIFA